MGLKDIVKIVEDAFLSYPEPYYENEELCKEVGEAVLKAISETRHIQSGITHVPILNHANAVQFIDQVDQTDQRLYLWSKNTLRKIQDLPDEEFALIDKILANEKARRKL
ncbi:MAG: hypothetical protein ACOC4M_13245 [Promethearchaeia archaeon]